MVVVERMWCAHEYKYLRVMVVIGWLGGEMDHRDVGTRFDLFFFHPLSPGSCFFTPRGAVVFNALLDFVRELGAEFGYDEVITPNIFNMELWEKSGHALHYASNMFLFDIEAQTFGLKPMNCPAHCLMYKSCTRSYRELPMRYADFGALHRNEASGALSGLTRSRKFHQDDGHVFCRPDQIADEIRAFLRMLDRAYGTLGLRYGLALSTRPAEGSLGDDAAWEAAEGALRAALDAGGVAWTVKEGDGAFYGPKIDVSVADPMDASGIRSFQCATLQLDFQLPEKFDLQFVDASGGCVTPQRPVLIHRAVLGSFERMLALLAESCAGAWPVWLSPRHVMVIPVGLGNEAYAATVRARIAASPMRVGTGLRNALPRVDLDASGRKMQKKIREAELARYNFVLVVGDAETAAATVNVRRRGGSCGSSGSPQEEEMSLDAFLEILAAAFRRRARD